MKRFLKLLTGPFAFVLAFVVFGTPSAPGVAVAPTVGGVAHAYVGTNCGRAYAFHGHEQARACLGLGWVDRVDWHDLRCSIYSGMTGIGGILVAGGLMATYFGIGGPIAAVGGALGGVGTAGGWLDPIVAGFPRSYVAIASR